MDDNMNLDPVVDPTQDGVAAGDPSAALPADSDAAVAGLPVVEDGMGEDAEDVEEAAEELA